MSCLGVDYDGTIADTNGQKAAWIQKHLGIDVPAWQCDRSSCIPIIGCEHYRAMCDVVYEEQSTLAASPVPGAIEALRKLSASSSVYVVTARLRHRVDFARQWLHQHGLVESLKGVLSSSGTTKRSLCERFGMHVLIDDDVRHLEPLIGGATLPVLLRVGDTEVPGHGLPTFASWEALLEDLDASPGSSAP